MYQALIALNGMFSSLDFLLLLSLGALSFARSHASTCPWAGFTKHVLDSPKQPLHLFETGNILLYLAERSGKFLPTDPAAKAECLNWLFFNVSFGVASLSMMFSRAGMMVMLVVGEVVLLCLLLLLIAPNLLHRS